MDDRVRFLYFNLLTKKGSNMKVYDRITLLLGAIRYDHIMNFIRPYIKW